ncbi:16S rRNA (guanine(527)-N(7))-methyltransferase RsmG [Ahrensia sp. R2A130]|uniref:16S rRNA (guanine(527)-N(7))-methyltransferase RsmG n=1 Tax=Ahrensia sp. R2A130 TaxID=744979 RepID=UPI0001E0AC90|nr:16S rRNA (guanine(527)-N(7))-methyltransferase RsmG [Ahrensia sp. R2A130]EFL89697.1 16S rRNA methyltransferase GidB [Ahrensia sp. R2A130]
MSLALGTQEILSGVSRETAERLQVYHDLLVKWQKQINLVSPSTIPDAWQRHFLDSMQIAPLITGGTSLVDFGSGAGFPGLVLAIMNVDGPLTNVHLVESNGKKAAFLRAVLRDIGLAKTGMTVTVHNERVEVVSTTMPAPDWITARALSSLSELLTMSAPLWGAPTRAIFPKGREHKAEITQAEASHNFSYAVHDSRSGDGSVLVEITEFSH